MTELFKEDTFLTPSYNDIHNACVGIAGAMKATIGDVKNVIGVARGGLLPAVILSHTLNKPLIVVEYSSKAGKGDDKEQSNNLPILTPEQGPVLIVDDICDSGHTLNEIVYHFNKLGVSVVTAVLFYKTHENQVMIPDLYWRQIPSDAGWVTFPFEVTEPL